MTVAQRAARAAALFAVAAAAASCALLPGPDAAGEPYPTAAPNLGTLDVHVFRSDDRLSFTNTSAVTFDDARLWVNAAFGYDVGAVAPGQRVDAPLGEFVDRHGRAFRAGGFFATERPQRVVLVEIEHAGVRRGVVVVEDRAE